MGFIYTCILLKRSLESVARISLHNRLQTPADPERLTGQATILTGCFLHDHLQFL